MKAGIVSNSEICVPLLQLLQQNRIPVSVFANVEDRSQFLGVDHFCKSYSIPVQEAGGSSAALYDWLDQTRPDVVFIIGYRHLIDTSRLSPALLSHTFNIHFGPLPSFKGPNPVFWQLKKGTETITVSIHRINDRYDEGPVVWAKEVPRQPHFNYGLVNNLCSQLLLEGAVYLLQLIGQQKTIPALPASPAKKAYHKRPVLQDVLIAWDTMPAKEIVHLVNACNPWNKGAMTFYNRADVKILDAAIVRPATPLPATTLPGTIIADAGHLHIACCDRQAININMLFAYNSFIPAYQGREWGFAAGKKFGA
ncbi:MAG: formyltransferase family protein [Chitinophagaceae bacterium]